MKKSNLNKPNFTRFSTLTLILLSLIFPSISPASAATTPSITNGSWTTISSTWGDGAVAITSPTSTSNGEWSYFSRNSTIASVIGSVLSINNVGRVTLVATQAATADFFSTSVNISVIVAGKVPTIGAFTIPSQSMNNLVYTLDPPPSTSAGAWTFRSSNENIAKISGTTATLVGAGTAVITATQAANWNWDTISTNATLTVSGATPLLGNFSSVTLTLGVFNSITLVPPTSNSTGVWSYISSNTGVATVLANQISPVGAGTTTITATQSPAGNFSAGVSSMTLTVLGGPPTLGKFANIDAALRPLSANTFTLTPPTSNSSGVWTFVSSDSSIVSISGNIATLYQVGTVTITANQSASGNFAGSGSTTMRFTVLPATPTLATWGNIEKSFGESTFNLTPPSSSSAGTWSYSSSNPTIATITGNTVTILSAGQTSIIATQTANWNWSETTTQLTLNVLPIAPTVSGFAAFTAVVGDPDVAITAPTSNSTAPWIYTSSNSAIATISGGTLAIVDSGAATITAKQAAGGNYLASEEISTTVKVYKRPVIGALENKSVKFGDTTFVLTPPTSSSVGAWSYSSSNPTVATIAGNNVTILGAGQTTIIATQAANENWIEATTQLTLNVLPITPTISGFTALTAVVGDPAITITAPTSNSTAPWTYTSSNSTIATISSGTLAIVDSGTATITAKQAAGGNYLASEEISTTVKVYKRPVIGALENKSVKFGTETLLLTLPTSDSDGSWIVESSDPSVLTVNGLNLEVKKVGKVIITVKQSQTETYLAAEKSFELVVNPVTPVLGTFAEINKLFTATPSKLIAPTSSSNGVWSYQVSDESIGVVVDGNLVLKKAGTATITATQAATSDYLGTQISTTLQVNPYIRASASKRVITITANGVKAKVYINGKKAKIGKNTVTTGEKIVTVLVGGEEIYKKRLKII